MGIRINILITFLGLLLFVKQQSYASRLSDQVADIFVFLEGDMSEAEEKALILMDNAADVNDYDALMRCNYLLGWIYLHRPTPDYAKAILHNLEGVRYAKRADYPQKTSELVDVYLNTAAIFSIFRDFEKSEKYYQEGMEVCQENGMVAMYGKMLLATAQLYHEQNRLEDALELLALASDHFDFLAANVIAEVYNTRGLIYTALGDVDQAVYNFHTLQEFVKHHEDIEASWTSYSLHNIGDAYMQQGDYQQALDHFELALDYRKALPNNERSVMFTLADLGECALELGQLDLARAYFDEAEQLIDMVDDQPLIYRLYKSIGRMHRELNNIELYANYQELYGATMEAFLAQQRQIGVEDKKYQLEVITAKYFAAIEKQESVRNTRRYGTMGVTFLLLVIAIILGKNRYAKYRLRRDLEESLRPYAETVYVD